jgi:hypothetical protein
VHEISDLVLLYNLDRFKRARFIAHPQLRIWVYSPIAPDSADVSPAGDGVSTVTCGAATSRVLTPVDTVHESQPYIIEHHEKLEFTNVMRFCVAHTRPCKTTPVPHNNLVALTARHLQVLNRGTPVERVAEVLIRIANEYHRTNNALPYTQIVTMVRHAAREFDVSRDVAIEAAVANANFTARLRYMFCRIFHPFTDVRVHRS